MTSSWLLCLANVEKSSLVSLLSTGQRKQKKDLDEEDASAETHMYTGTHTQNTHPPTWTQAHTRSHTRPHSQTQWPVLAFPLLAQLFISPETWRTALLGLQFLHLENILWGPFHDRCQIQEFLNCGCFHQCLSLTTAGCLPFFPKHSETVTRRDSGLP